MRNTAPLRRRVLARRKSKPLQAVAVTLEMAMTGVMLTLLIIVMLVEGVTPHHSTMPADMAKVQHAVPMLNAKREDAIRIILTRDGAVYFGHTETRVGDLAEQIRQKVREGSERREYLMVDQRAKNRDVENVVDAIRASGIWNVGLLVEQDRSVAARP
ncbi:MAG TPA: biopolymer transporter ExbD [Candidatus Acidoferrum sp.]|jgi:biopolymer transport protein ExbD